MTEIEKLKKLTGESDEELLFLLLEEAEKGRADEAVQERRIVLIMLQSRSMISWTGTGLSE